MSFAKHRLEQKKLALSDVKWDRTTTSYTSRGEYMLDTAFTHNVKKVSCYCERSLKIPYSPRQLLLTLKQGLIIVMMTERKIKPESTFLPSGFHYIFCVL